MDETQAESAATLVVAMAKQAEKRQAELRRILWAVTVVVVAVAIGFGVAMDRLSDAVHEQSKALARRSVVLEYLTCRDARQTEWQAALIDAYSDQVVTQPERDRIDATRARLDQAERVQFAPGHSARCKG